MEIKKDEKLIRKSRCNFRNNPLDAFDWVGGRFFLTDQRLLFKPNIFNFKTNMESIPLKDIGAIEVKKMILYPQNCL